MWIGVVQRPDAEGVRDLLPVVLQTDLQPGAGCRIVQVAKLSVERVQSFPSFFDGRNGQKVSARHVAMLQQQRCFIE